MSTSASPSLPPCSIAYTVEPGGLPAFRPTPAQFVDFHRLMAAVQPIGALTGLIKVIPPPSYVPNSSLYSNLSSTFPVHSPIEQNIAGQAGVYQVLSVTQPTCTIADFIDQTARAERQRSPRELQWLQDGEYERLEGAYWKNIGFSRPVYGADSPGSLFDADAPWNMAHLHTLLDLIPSRIGGVTHPMTYWGQWKATFAAHVEDLNLFSINYLHFGHPKQWYAVPSSSHLHFESIIASHYPSLASSCPQFLRHKDVLIKPSKLRERGVPVLQGIQREGEFMVTFPCAYHQGFNLGFNCAESVNFAVEEWVAWGEQAEVCECRSTSVNIDVAEMKQKLSRVKQARQQLIDRGEADDNVQHAPLSMDLINSSPHLRAALDAAEAESDAPMASGQRSMVAMATDEELSPAEALTETGEGEGSREEAEDPALAEPALVEDDVEVVTYEEDFIPHGVSVQLRCGYDDCDGQFRSMKSLLKHYQTAHSGPKTTEKAAQRGRGRSRRGRRDSEEEEEEDFRSKRKRNSGRAKRRRRRDAEEEEEEEAEEEVDAAAETGHGGTVGASTEPQSLRQLLRRKAEQLRLGDRWKRVTDPIPPPQQPEPSSKAAVMDERKEASVEGRACDEGADSILCILQHRQDQDGATFFQVQWNTRAESTWEPLQHVRQVLAELYPQYCVGGSDGGRVKVLDAAPVTRTHRARRVLEA